MSSEIYWQSVSFSSLQIKEWDEEFTVFQPDSGKTHFLNQMGMSIISNLDKSPATEAVICQFLMTQFQLAPDQDFSLQINKILNRFNALGLIEKVALDSSI